MNCSQITSNPDIYKIIVPFPNVSTNATNCYVVCDGNEALVIDVGAPSEEGLSLLRGCLADIGVDVERAAFFLTHFHLDHAGLSDALIPSGATLYVSEREYNRTRLEQAASHGRALKERLQAIGACADEAEMAALMQEQGSQHVVGAHKIQFVAEGDVIRVGSVKLQVVDTSGHTAGHLSLYEEGSRSLFGGDHVLFVISPSIDYFGEGGDGLQTYLDNLEKLKGLPLERVFCAHGEFRVDHRERIDWLSGHHRKRLEETCATARERGEVPGMELIHAMKWNVPGDSWEDVSLLQRAIIITQGLVILDHLVFSGRLDVCQGEDGIVRYHLKSQ